jgi:catechol 2,3-dioxygenase-like lactoylglutathione lyase family enzyme
MKLGYVIKFVADMNRAVKFYRDVLGLDLKFESPLGASLPPAKLRLHCIQPLKKIPRELLNWVSRLPTSKNSTKT